MSNKTKPSFKVINWDFNHDDIEFYDVMPYFISCWKEEKTKKHKMWNMSFGGDDNKCDDTKMPETFEEFKKFILEWSHYNFWARCEYEVIVTGWPVQKHQHKLDVHEQVKSNIDVITKLFMDYING